MELLGLYGNSEEYRGGRNEPDKSWIRVAIPNALLGPTQDFMKHGGAYHSGCGRRSSCDGLLLLLGTCRGDSDRNESIMHDCREAKEREYEIHVRSETDHYKTYLRGINYIYDKKTHGYIFNINFCPFCGEAL